jgi:hypothetical protein
MQITNQTSYFESLVKFHAGQNHTTKMWQSSNTWELLTSQITFMKKLRVDGTQGMPATIRSRIFGFQSAMQKCKDWNIQNYNFASYFIGVWNLVASNEERMQAEGAREYGTEEAISA